MKTTYHLVIFDWEGTISESVLQQPYQFALIPGVKACIQHLAAANMRLAIATNKGAQSLARDLQDSGLSQYFKVTRSASETAPKPDPQMLVEILNEVQIKPHRALMIGDSEWDMVMAQQIQMPCIGVDFSHQNEALLLASGAKKVFQNYQDVLSFILQDS